MAPHPTASGYLPSTQQFVIDDTDEPDDYPPPRHSYQSTNAPSYHPQANTSEAGHGRKSSVSTTDGDLERGLNREEIEKDTRFMDDSKLEEGEDEGFLYGGRNPPKPPPRRSPTFLLILLLLLLLSFIVGSLSALSFTPTTKYLRKNGKKHMTMDSLYDGTFGVRRREVGWVEEAGDGIFSFQTPSGDIFLQDVANNGSQRLLVNASEIVRPDGEPLKFVAWKLSADMKYVMFKTSYTKQWRHSSFGNYWAHRLSDQLTFPLNVHPPPGTKADTTLVTWAPVSHSLAFVQGNNLYVVPDTRFDAVELAEEYPRRIQVTSDGGETVFNGVPDWVYEEEVFQTNSALWWNPEGDTIAFLKSDETQVYDYTLQFYQHHDAPFGDYPYPDNFVMKYPKPGTPNPLVTLYTFSLAKHFAGHTDDSATPPLNLLSWSDEMDIEQRVIIEVGWVGAYDLLVKETDRAANHGNVVLFREEELRGKVVRKLGKDGEEGDDGWIEHSANVFAVTGDVEGYLDIVPTPEGYNHIALFSPLDSSEPIWLTSGEWEVSDGIASVDLKNGIVYYMAALPSIERHLYTAKIPDSVDALQGWVASTEIVESTAEPGYFGAKFSPQSGYYVLSYEGPDIPWQKLIRVSDGAVETVLEDNAKLSNTSSEYLFPIINHQTFESDGYTLNIVETLPANFDGSGRKKYPVLFNPYGGPTSQTVNTKFKRDWAHYLANEKQMVIVTVDGRGTGYLGRKLRNPIKDDLGHWEVVDQINVAREWAKKKYVDNKRVGIWGWSFGGTVVCKAMEADSGIFTLGMAVAPVTNWLYYDSIYTERYMSTPEENPDGYHAASITNTTGFRHVDFLLAHGSGDDNVHFTNTASLLDKLTADHVRGWWFRLFPDADHSLSRGSDYREVMEWITSFLDEKWFGIAPKHS